MKTLLPFAALLTVAPLSRAEVFDVGGPSPDFDNIQDAIHAAADGDLIRVFGLGGSGTRQVPGFTVNGKALRIVVVPGSGQVRTTSAVRVRDLPAGEAFLLRGLAILGTSLEGALLISNCEGHLRFEDLNVVHSAPDGHITSLPSDPATQVLSCADVSFKSCGVDGADGWYFEDYALMAPSGDALYVENSTLSLFDCAIEGGEGVDFATNDDARDGGDGRTGIEAVSSSLFLSGCTIEGGFGGAGGACGLFDDESGNGGDGGTALIARDSTLFEVLDCVFAGGFGGFEGWSFNCEPGVPGEHGPDFEISADSTRIDHAGPARHLSVDALVQEAGEMVIRFEGRRYDRVLLFVGRPGFESFPGIAGPRLFRGLPAVGSGGSVSERFIPGGVANVNGLLTLRVDLPDLPLLTDQAWTLQALIRSRTRLSYYGPVSEVSILDSAY